MFGYLPQCRRVFEVRRRESDSDLVASDGSMDSGRSLAGTRRESTGLPLFLIVIQPERGFKLEFEWLWNNALGCGVADVLNCASQLHRAWLDSGLIFHMAWSQTVLTHVRVVVYVCVFISHILAL